LYADAHHVPKPYAHPEPGWARNIKALPIRMIMQYVVWGLS
jgi:hypothetical protein